MAERIYCPSILIYFFFFLIVACGNQIESDPVLPPLPSNVLGSIKPINIEYEGSVFNIETYLRQQNNSILAKDLIDTAWYIPLETRNDVLIGEIDKIIVSKNNIVIGDFFTSKNIFVFDSLGRFQFKLNKGKGPGEINNPTDFILDTSHELLLVFDGTLHKLLTLDLSGNILKEQPTKTRFENFRVWKDGFITYTGMSENPILGSDNNKLLVGITDSLYPISTAFDFKTEELNNDYGARDNFSEADILTFGKRFYNEFYEIDNDKIKLIYKFSLGKYTVPEEMFNKPFVEFKEDVRKSELYYNLGDHVISTSHFYLNFKRFNKFPVSFFLNRYNSNLISFSNFETSDSLLPIFSTPVSSFGKYFVSFVQAEYFINILSSMGSSKEKWNKNFPQNIASPNPVILFYSIK